MHFSDKITFIIYVFVFISANVFHCIDVSNETVTVSVTMDAANESTIYSNGAESNGTDQTTELESATQPQDIDDAMQMCNQSFPTPKESLIELNITGTLPDETDETSACFIRCYLEKMGILKTDILDRERGMDLDLARNEDILDDCSKESRDQKDMCFRAYHFLRCVAIWNLVYDDAK